MTQGPGNIVYMPPEAMGEHTQYNTSLDIFSFGNIALFTLTQEFIGPKLKAATYTDNAGKINAHSEIERREYGFRAIYRDLGKENALTQLTRDCLQNHPAGRPNAADLVERIKKISSHVVPPSKLELMKQLSSKREEISQMADKIKQLMGQQVSLHEEIENNHTQLKELREVVRTQEEQIQSIEKRLADMLAQGSVSRVEARQLQAEIEKMKVRVLLELTEKLNQFCLTANKLPGVEVSTPTVSSPGPTGTLYPDLMTDYTIISMQDKALAPPTLSISGGGDLQVLLPQAKKLSELLQTNVSALETLVMKSAKGTITISSNHALIKIARPAEYEKDDIVLFHPMRIPKSGALFPAVLHLERPRPYILMDDSSHGAFGIRPRRLPELFLSELFFGELTEKPRMLKFEDHKDIAAELPGPSIESEPSLQR